MANGAEPLRAGPSCPVHCSRSSAAEPRAYSTKHAVVDSKIMNVNTFTIDFS